MSVLKATPESIQQAVEILAAGKLAALPTETVYGLAGDATNGQAVASIFSTKGRPQFNPLIAHVADQEMAENYVIIDPLSRKLMQAFWPGPLTLVLPMRENSAIHPLVTAGLHTVAIRNPRGIFAEIVNALARPVAAPSANSSGRLSPTTAKAVNDDLGDKIPLIVDGGACPVGLESTIVKVDQDKVFLLRPGGIAAEELEKVTGCPLLRLDQRAAIEAPGMLESHYAPHVGLRMDVHDLHPDEALLNFHHQTIENAQHAVACLDLSPSGSVEEAATNLFAYMKKLDRTDVRAIAVAPIPMRGLGEAINDRLRRAAAPRGKI